MNQLGLTSLVYNAPYAKQLGIPTSYYRWRSCQASFPNRTQTSVTGSSPADQYQKLKLMQNTVRVYGSLYTANLGPLAAYAPAINDPQKGLYNVCWNQMSDRPIPSVQPASIPTGFRTSMNRRHTSVTSSRPGCQTPGGKGCDIKHNSYDRYLNRLKGKAPMRRGVIPPNFGRPIPFNCAGPVYGGKVMKTNIVAGCGCPLNSPQDKQVLYNNPYGQAYPTATIFQVGQYVYAVEGNNMFYSRALITAYENSGVYTIQFDDGTVQTATTSQLLVYFPCNCNATENNITFPSGLYTTTGNVYGVDCTLPVDMVTSLTTI
jgi:hypothetical protein